MTWKFIIPVLITNQYTFNMLTIKTIGELIGHKFEDGWEVTNIDTTDIDYPNCYSIQLDRFGPMIYNPMTFNSHRKLMGSKWLILNRMGFKGTYRMHNLKDVTNSLSLDISLMDKKEKLIAAIKFIM